MNKSNNEDPILARLKDLEDKVNTLELYTFRRPESRRAHKECLKAIADLRTDAEKIIAESDRRTKLYHDECTKNLQNPKVEVA